VSIWERIKKSFTAADPLEQMGEVIERVRKELPTPCIALLGEPQVGKSSIVRFLTGDPRARIGFGDGIPVTKHFEVYQFPKEAEIPLWLFLDMPGLGTRQVQIEREELQTLLEGQAMLAPQNTPLPAPQMFIVCARIDDRELGILNWLNKIIEQIGADRSLPPFLVIQTCLHRLWHPHPDPYPFGEHGDLIPVEIESHIGDQIKWQRQQISRLVPDAHFCIVDLTDPDDEVGNPHYGGEALFEAILEQLPEAIANMMREQRQAFDSAFGKEADKLIWSYSIAAATAGAIPPPVGDMATITVALAMLRQLASLYRQKWELRTVLDLLWSLGSTTLLWVLLRYLGRRIPVPLLAAPLGAAGAFALCFSLGHLMSWYYAQVLEGHIPVESDIREQWKKIERESIEQWKNIARSFRKKDKT
jgi:uncharacterized protein (DUF697 family)